MGEQGQIYAEKSRNHISKTGRLMRIEGWESLAESRDLMREQEHRAPLLLRW